MILTSNAESLENTEITYRTEAVADGSTYRRVFIAVGLATAGARLRLARPASHSSQDSRSDMILSSRRSQSARNAYVEPVDQQPHAENIDRPRCDCPWLIIQLSCPSRI
jgi:hypothetical protein